MRWCGTRGDSFHVASESQKNGQTIGVELAVVFFFEPSSSGLLCPTVTNNECVPLVLRVCLPLGNQHVEQFTQGGAMPGCLDE